MRDPSNAKKLDPIKKAFGDLFNRLEIVQMDLTSKDSIVNAMKGVDILIHVASPIGEAENTYEVYIKPAQDGANAFIEAAEANKVKKIVVTSSITTINNIY